MLTFLAETLALAIDDQTGYVEVVLANFVASVVHLSALCMGMSATTGLRTFSSWQADDFTCPAIHEFCSAAKNLVTYG